MLQLEEPEDFVISTGKQSSVREFIEMSAAALNWDGIKWIGEGINEVGIREDTGDTVIKIDKRYFRPSEVDSLLGNPDKAYEKLGWRPSTNLDAMIKEMIQHDELEAKHQSLKKSSFA